MPKKSSSVGKSGRSAITGRYVKQSTVARNPRTTVNESRTTKKKLVRARALSDTRWREVKQPIGC